MYVLEQTKKMKAEKRNFRGSQKAPSGLNTESVDSHADSEETIERENRGKGGRIGVNGVNRVRSRRSSRVGSVTGEENNENENGKKEKEKEKEGKGKGKEDKEVEGGEIGEGEGGNKIDAFGSVVFFTVNVAPKTSNGKVTFNDFKCYEGSDLI